MNETTNAPTATPPFVQLNPNYGMVKAILLAIVTFGIYGFFFWSKASSDINLIASRSDGKKTMNGALMMILSILLAVIPIVQLLSWLIPVIWSHSICARMGSQLKARNIQYTFGAGTYWGWGFFGALVIVGPFIWLYKFCHAMNLLCNDYNAKKA